MSQEVSESTRSSLPRRLLMTGVKVAVSVALLALLFSRVDVSKLWANARQASLAWIAVALGVYVVTILATVWRWWLLLEAQAQFDSARATVYQSSPTLSWLSSVGLYGAVIIAGLAIVTGANRLLTLVSLNDTQLYDQELAGQSRRTGSPRRVREGLPGELDEDSSSQARNFECSRKSERS